MGADAEAIDGEKPDGEGAGDEQGASDKEDEEAERETEEKNETADDTPAVDEIVTADVTTKEEEEVPASGVTLLSFVMGADSVAFEELEKVLALEGTQLEGGPEGPSLAFPTRAYSAGCTPPRPWGACWAEPAAKSAVVFAVHTRAISAVARRILAG